MYLLAILFPPLAVLLCGKPFQAVLCVILTLFFWIPGVIHAMAVVADCKANQRTAQMAAAVRGR
jgi:uncharacterized membrane protein YqaE (UPF0057 family)